MDVIVRLFALWFSHSVRSRNKPLFPFWERGKLVRESHFSENTEVVLEKTSRCREFSAGMVYTRQEIKTAHATASILLLLAPMRHTTELRQPLMLRCGTYALVVVAG